VNIETYLKARLQKAVDAIGLKSEPPPKINLSPSKQKDHGDFATNLPFQLAPVLRKSPREIGEQLLKYIKTDPSRIEKVEIAGAGFINFTLSFQFLQSMLRDILKQDSTYGHADWGQDRKTQIEFVSANPTGPLTIGHGRQAVIGDVLSRLLKATGHDITREYYFNDAGNQMRVLGESVRLRYLELLGESVDFPEDYYQGEYIREIAGKALEEKGKTLRSSEDSDYFRSLAETEIFDLIKQTVEKLGIRFDVFYNEKSLYETGKIDAVIRELRNKDLAYDQDGAVWFRTTKLGMDQDRVIVKSSGEPTYRLPDIAYHKDKFERGFDLIVDIFGADHIATYPDVLAGLEALGYDRNKVKVLIHQFVTLIEGKEKIKMSTRKANFVTLDELMDEVGVDVTRYFFINRSMSSHLNFDLTLAKTESEENPVYYVQYAHARICSILRHAKKQSIDPESKADLSLLGIPEEIDLIKILMAFPRIVTEASQNFEPHRIPAYLEEVATVYHRFQHAGKKQDVLRVVTDNKPLTLARLALCRAARIVLANGLSLLGISKPEKM
jgi:arginyl-tRNA synthetase